MKIEHRTPGDGGSHDVSYRTRLERALDELGAQQRAARRVQHRIREFLGRHEDSTIARIANPPALARLRTAYAAAAERPSPDWRAAFQVAGRFTDGDAFERALNASGQLLVTYESRVRQVRSVVMGPVEFEDRAGVFVGLLPEDVSTWFDLITAPLTFSFGDHERKAYIAE